MDLSSCTSVSLYHIGSRFAGDVSSAPHLYFNVGRAERLDIESARAAQVAALGKRLKFLIVGGGGLFLDIWTTKVMRIVFAANLLGIKTVVWGVGVNDHNSTESTPPGWLSKVDHVGIRDSGLGFRWVPCASCMSESFDKRRSREHPLVIYDHSVFSVPVRIHGVPRINNSNSMDIGKILDFLGSAETVFTTSYHGTYWATLLGCKVVVWPFSSKFRYMRHPPVLAETNDWVDLMKRARSYPDSLDECREANRSFYKDVLGCVPERRGRDVRHTG